MGGGRLVRGVPRTAVISGTASAVNGRVSRHQAEKFADQDQQIAANRGTGYATGAQAAYQQPAPPAPAPAPVAAPASSKNDTISQLKDLAALKEQGILTQEEFDAQKAKVLSG
jgi:hypothetical protein